jgi:RND family efflux transporter MFP subunit
MVPNPTLQLDFYDAAPLRKMAITQGLNWLPRRGAEITWGTAVIERARADSIRLMADIGREVRRAFFGALAGRARSDFALDQRAVADSLVMIAERRLASGDISSLERDQVKLEAGRTIQAASRTAEEAAASGIEFARAIGSTGQEAIPTGDLDEGLTSSDSIPYQISEAPELRAAIADSLAAAARLRSARLGQIPPLAFRGGREWGGNGGGGAGNPATAFVGFSIGVPIWSRGRENVAEAAGAFSDLAAATGDRRSATRSGGPSRRSPAAAPLGGQPGPARSRLTGSSGSPYSGRRRPALRSGKNRHSPPVRCRSSGAGGGARNGRRPAGIPTGPGRSVGRSREGTVRRAGWALIPLLSGCGASPDSKPAPPAAVRQAVSESDLTTITLTMEAFTRLGIEVAPVDSGVVAEIRQLGGDVMAPPGQTLSIAAPAAGTVLAPLGAPIPAAGRRVSKGDHLLRLLALPPDQATVRQTLAVARARLSQAEAEAKRVADLFTDKLVSAREHERAQADLAAAQAAFQTASAQQQQVEEGSSGDARGLSPLLIVAPVSGVIRTLDVGVGQAVSAGTVLVEIVGLERLWVRVPMYAGDLRNVDRRRPAGISPLGGSTAPPATGRPITGPPLADPTAASVDLFYEVRGPSSGFRPGERVMVSLPLIVRGAGEEAVTVPLTALLLDHGGGTWVYQRLDSLSFARRRVEVSRVAGDRAVITRGIAVGAMVVTAGAAELFGTEFGPGK